MMRRRFGMGLVAAALGSLAPAPPAAAFRAMTWNIRGGPTSREQSPAFRLDAVRAVVENVSPDILALQEVCSWQAAALGASLGYAWHEATITSFADERDGSGGRCDYGNALLSKTPIAALRRYRTDLLAPSEGCKHDAPQGRGPPECRLDMGALIIPGAIPPVRAASAHVGTAREPYLPGLDQSLQLERLVGDAERNEPITLMMGDYNVLPEDARMAPRMEALGYRDAGSSVGGRPCGATPGCEPTFPSGGEFGAPAAKIDYIYYRGLVALHHEVVEPLVDGIEASDHRAVVADFAGVPLGRS